jgi:transcriptional regulator with XRE-family HTH domain
MAGCDWECESAAAVAGSVVASFIGARVCARRVELRLMTETLAVAIGLTPEALSSIEAGKQRPTPQQLALLASKLGVSVTWFFEGMPEPLRTSTMLPPAAGSAVIEFPQSALPNEPDEQSSGS